METAIQLTLAELNENLRQIYVEAYTLPENLEIIHRMTAEMLHRIFGAYMPGYSVSDFYESDISSAAIMRGYMARPCDVYFTLERKLERFLQLTLRIYCVPEEKQREVMALIANLDIRAIANEVMQRLFAALEMHYEFTLGEEGKANLIKKEPHRRICTQFLGTGSKLKNGFPSWMLPEFRESANIC